MSRTPEDSPVPAEQTGADMPPVLVTRPPRPYPIIPSWIDDSTEAAESFEQGDVILALVDQLSQLARMRSWSGVTIGHDNYFSWVPENPNVRVSPDVYLVDAERPLTGQSWKTWLPGHRPPRWAVEVVSEDWRKDYFDGPAKYAQLGCDELVLFDPSAAAGEIRSGPRVPITVYRRRASGELERVYAGPGPAWSEQTGCWLQMRVERYRHLLRLSEDEAGERLIPTAQSLNDDLARALEKEKRRRKKPAR
jgi:Uma2 family endonuclease